MASDPSRKENKDMLLEKSTTRPGKVTTYPDYIRHWEEATPTGWEIRILTEKGLHIFNCKWKDYKRPRELTKREGCPHN